MAKIHFPFPCSTKLHLRVFESRRLPNVRSGKGKRKGQYRINDIKNTNNVLMKYASYSKQIRKEMEKLENKKKKKG